MLSYEYRTKNFLNGADRFFTWLFCLKKQIKKGAGL